MTILPDEFFNPSEPNPFRFSFEDADELALPDTRAAAGVVRRPGGQTVSEHRFDFLFPDFIPLGQRPDPNAPVKPEGVPGGATAAERAFNFQQGLFDAPLPIGGSVDLIAPEGEPGEATAAEQNFKTLAPFLRDLIDSGGATVDRSGGFAGDTGDKTIGELFGSAVNENALVGGTLGDTLSELGINPDNLVGFNDPEASFNIENKDVANFFGNLIGGPLGAGVASKAFGASTEESIVNAAIAALAKGVPVVGIPLAVVNALFDPFGFDVDPESTAFTMEDLDRMTVEAIEAAFGPLVAWNSYEFGVPGTFASTFDIESQAFVDQPGFPLGEGEQGEGGSPGSGGSPGGSQGGAPGSSDADTDDGSGVGAGEGSGDDAGDGSGGGSSGGDDGGDDGGAGDAA